MILDYVSEGIIQDVRQSVADVFEKDVHADILRFIVMIQKETINEGMEKRKAVKIDYVGKFILSEYKLAHRIIRAKTDEQVERIARRVVNKQEKELKIAPTLAICLSRGRVKK